MNFQCGPLTCTTQFITCFQTIFFSNEALFGTCSGKGPCGVGSGKVLTPKKKLSEFHKEREEKGDCGSKIEKNLMNSMSSAARILKQFLSTCPVELVHPQKRPNPDIQLGHCIKCCTGIVTCL